MAYASNPHNSQYTDQYKPKRRVIDKLVHGKTTLSCFSWWGWYTGWIMLTAFTTMRLFEGAHIEHMTHVDIIHYHAIYCNVWEASGWVFTVGAGACLYTGCTYYLHHCYTCKNNGQASIWLDTAGHRTSTTMMCNSLCVAPLRQHVLNFQSVITVMWLGLWWLCVCKNIFFS